MAIDPVVTDAQFQREERLFNEWFDERLDVIFSEADTVGPHARHKLSGILKHYAKDPHPFRACVKDNTKRFGPGRVEKVCAVLKDIIRGQTHWRGHPELDHGAPGAIAASPPYSLDEETEKVLLSIPDDKLDALMLDAHEQWEMTVEFARRSRSKQPPPPSPTDPQNDPATLGQLIERQRAEAEMLWTWTKRFGKLDKSTGPNGSHFVDQNPFAAQGICCGNCVFFTLDPEGGTGNDGAPLGTCDLVDGQLEAEDVCKFWIIPGDKIKPESQQQQEDN